VPKVLYYGDIRLIRVEGRALDSWYVPGSEIWTTKKLLARAALHGVKVKTTEVTENGRVTQVLN
jgi:hypothetical protein